MLLEIFHLMLGEILLEARCSNSQVFIDFVHIMTILAKAPIKPLMLSDSRKRNQAGAAVGGCYDGKHRSRLALCRPTEEISEERKLKP